MNLVGVGRDGFNSRFHRSSSGIHSSFNVFLRSKTRSLLKILPQFPGVLGDGDQTVVLRPGFSVHLLLEPPEFLHGAIHYRIEVILGFVHVILRFLDLVFALKLEIGPRLVRLDLEELHEVFNGGRIESLVVEGLIWEEWEFGKEGLHFLIVWWEVMLVGVRSEMMMMMELESYKRETFSFAFSFLY